MTVTAFIPFERKPAKGKASSILKQLGFTERAATSTMWVFGLSRFKVEVLDFRDDMVKSDRAEWVDEVGWQHKWAIGVSIHTQRREEQYVQWHVLAATLAWAYGSKEIWLDGATNIPQEAFNLEEFFEGISKSEDAEDKSPMEDMPDLEEPVSMAQQYMPPQEPVPVPEPAPAPAPEPLPQPELVAVAEDNDEDDEDDDGWEDWDDWDEDEAEAEEDEKTEPEPVAVQDDEEYQFDDDDDEDDGLVDSITSW